MRRVSLTTALAVALLVGPPTAAWAHAGFISSTPEPGSELGTAPGVVVLRFSEPLNMRLSRVSVTAPDGAVVLGRVTSPQSISVSLVTNAQGRYEVGWETVSLLDGHTLSGSFAFGVGVPAGPGAEGGTSTSPRTTDMLIALARLVEDVGLLLAAGLLLLARLARRGQTLQWIRARPVVPLLLASVGGTVVVLSEAVAAAHGPHIDAMLSYLTTGLPGLARLGRPLLEASALVLALRGSVRAWVPVFLTLIALAAAGHAAAVDPAWQGISVEAVHISGASLWAGGLLALAFQRPPGGWRGAEARTLLDRFTPIALAGFIMTAAAGAVRGLQEVGSVSALVSSSYGATLLLKTLLVVLMAQLSLFAWRRLLVLPRVESVVALAIIGFAVVLAAYPLPPSREREAELEETRASAASASGLPRKGDLTLGGHAGTFLIGLTIRPSAETVLVYLHGPGSDADAGVRTVHADIDGQPVDVGQCGDTCRSIDIVPEQGATIDVTVFGAGGGSARFIVPNHASPSADSLLQRMSARMDALRTFRFDETLTGGAGTTHTAYGLKAPDIITSRTTAPDGSGGQLVWIGTTRYLRDLPGGEWRVDRGVAPTVPLFVWGSFEPWLDARLVDRSRVDGVPARVVVFFGGDRSLPVWFRLWIDRTGLVRRAEMRAPGHFMDHRYFAFNQPINVEAPKGVTA